MTPERTTVRRLLSGTVMSTALAVVGLAVAAPAAADPLVWGSAQAWSSSGDAVSGYSTAISHGGSGEGEAVTESTFGALSPYIEIKGRTRTYIDVQGAHAEAVVESATLRMEADDLVDLGIVELPPEDGSTPGQTASGTSTGQKAPPEDGPEERTAPSGGAPPPDDDREPIPRQTPSVKPSVSGTWPSPGEDDVIVLDDSNTRRLSSGGALTVTAADVTATASAGYDGTSATTFEHGDLTAFGIPTGPLEGDGNGYRVEDVLEVLDGDGNVVEEVPVSVQFTRHQTAFDDEETGWEGGGARTWLGVLVRIGEGDGALEYTVDLADAWVLGSTYTAGGTPEPGGRSESFHQGAVEEDRSGNRLAMTGSSLAALVTAAVIAVGGGGAATFLARKRPSALDDRFED